MHRLKLLGQYLAARDFDRRVPQLRIRVAVLNGDTALGMPVTEAGNGSAGKKGSSGLQRFVQQSHPTPQTAVTEQWLLKNRISSRGGTIRDCLEIHRRYDQDA